MDWADELVAEISDYGPMWHEASAEELFVYVPRPAQVDPQTGLDAETMNGGFPWQ